MEAAAPTLTFGGVGVALAPGPAYAPPTSGAVDSEVFAAPQGRTPPGPLADAAGDLCRELAVDRVSVATTGDDHFTIVAHAGRGILAAGTTLPLVTSTQILAAARGTSWSCGDFRREPAWAEPTDRLMLALGFRSGCSVPLRDDHGRVRGVVSASFLHPRGASDRRVAAIARAAPLLSRLMRESGSYPARRPTVLVCVEDDVAAQGVARLAERAGGLVVGTPRTLSTAVAHASSGVSVLVLDRRFDGQPAQAVAAALRAAGDVAAVVLAPASDSASSRRAAEAGGAGYAPRDGGSTRCWTLSRSRSPEPAAPGARRSTSGPC